MLSPTLRTPFRSPLRGPLRSLWGSVASALPALVFDFDDEYYRTSNSKTTFESAISHNSTTATNGTMVDSDGLLKWRPHNLLTYSEQFDNAAWVTGVAGTGSVTKSTTDAATAPDGTLTADRVIFDLAGGTAAGDQALLRQANATTGSLTHSVYLRSFDGVSSYTIQIIQPDGSGSNITVTGSWQRFDVSGTSVGNVNYGIRLRGGQSPANSDYADVLIWGAHLYRSDLGGMVNNPDRGDSYVPTTTAARYLPRRGHHVYNGSTWVNEGLLHESEQRVNLLTYSEDFTNAAWLKINTATLAVDATGPDGETSAVTLVDNGATGTGNVYTQEDVTVATSTTYTWSIFAKADQLSWAALRTGSFTTGDGTTYFDLNAGAIGTSAAAHTANIEDCGSGWYRISVTFTTDVSDTSGIVYVYVADADNDPNVDLDGTSSILIYGAQLEQASTPSSYIPTSGATATRGAETLTVAAADLPYDSTNMSIQMDGRMTYADTNSGNEVRWLQWGSGADPTIAAYLRTTSSRTGDPTWQQVDAVTTSVDGSDTAYSPGVLVPYNIASRHGSTFINGAVDGTALTANTTPTALPDLSAADLNLALTYMGTIRTFRMWDKDLGDAGIEEAST